MGNLSLGLLGSFRLETGAGASVLLPTKRARALLAYLALHPGKPQARSKLAALLWEDSSDARALGSLRQTLSALRKAAAAAGGDLLISRGDSVLLAPNILDVDVDRFEHLVGSSKPTDLETADGLYQGEFLEGFELRSSGLQRWISAERERLHERALEGLTKLLSHNINDGGIERGIRIATRLLLLDPLRESAQRTLMELYCKQGRHAVALHQYRVCAELLAKELGVEPEPATKALYRDIREQRNRLRNEARTAPPAQPDSIAAAEPDSPRSLERRQLTVLVCSLAGMSRVSATLDPEEASALIAEYHRSCSEIISRYGGVIDRFSADEMLVCFGYPQADEFDAEEAVHAGLALVEAAARLDTGGGGALLQLRVGIASGSVICGDLVGHGMDKHGLLGEAVELAAGLQAIAEPNAVVIAASTRPLVGGFFDCDPLGPIALKGGGEGVSAWRVTGASIVASRFEALRAGSTPLVGREEEMEVLLRRWQQAKGGEGRVVLLSGEPGIGKSRLAADLLERLTAEPHVRLRFFCSPHHQESALYPVITHLNQAAGFQREDSVAVRLDKLEALLSQGRSDLAEALPLIADLLTIPIDSRCKPLDLSPQRRKQRTLATLVAQVEGLAADQPVMMLFEDAHWSDPTSLELMDLLADRVPTLPLLVVMTFRPEFASSWVGRPHVSSLSLSRLPARHCIAVIAGITEGKVLPKEFADQITERSDGIPLFIEELTKAVIESGALVDVGDRYMATRPLPTLAIPTTLEGSLLARLDRLASARETAQIGAALGRRFSHELIAAVGVVPPEQLKDSLTRLETAELLYRRGTPPDAEYTFKHALVQNAAYGSLLRNKRQQIHARIVATLESQFPEIVAAQPGLMAGHCAEATMIEKALRYCVKAGQQAVARSAMIEGVTQLRRGVDLLALLQDGVERHQYELDLKVTLAAALVATQGYTAPEVPELYARVRTLCEELNRPSLLVWVVTGQWTYHVNCGELTLALRDAEEIVALGQARDDVIIKLIGCNSNTVTWAFLGDFLKARFYGEQGVALRVPELHTYADLWPDDLQTASFLFLSSVLVPLGYIDQALAWRDRGVTLAREREHANSLALVLFMSLTCDFILGTDPAILLACAEEQAALCAEHGQPYWGAQGAFHLGRCLTTIGRTEEGLALQRDAIAALRTMLGVTHPRYFVVLADTCRRAGRLNEGLTALDELERLIEATHDRLDEALLHLIRGDLLIGLGDLPAAEASFQKAITVARRQRAKLYELRAATSLALLWRDQGKRAEAHDLLAPVYGWFTEGFGTPVLQDAKALLTELS
jgi:DNA-binding SARP family transcriptional activator/tetratricopeptide (TPR) repeat protein